MHSSGRYLNSARNGWFIGDRCLLVWFCSCLGRPRRARGIRTLRRQRRRQQQAEALHHHENACRITTSLSVPPLSGDMDISVFSKYVSDMKRVYPAVEGRITFSRSLALTAPGLGFLLLASFLSLGLWVAPPPQCWELQHPRGRAQSWLTVSTSSDRGFFFSLPLVYGAQKYWGHVRYSGKKQRGNMYAKPKVVFFHPCETLIHFRVVVFFFLQLTSFWYNVKEMKMQHGSLNKKTQKVH